MAQNLSIETKRRLYDAGMYEMGVPPVNCSKWLRYDWVRHIDATGHWITGTAHKITKGNPNDKPMIECDYYIWLKDGGYTGHRIRDLKLYLHESGFVRGRDVLPTSTINALRHIHDHYFYIEIKPTLPAS